MFESLVHLLAFTKCFCGTL
jgi:hypothetical protein